ncbi:MAG: hypothetical protein HOW73_16875 [Polyangiaceae bacterium]|nr:hypothetical protein [Polyangiaceae bacterium]
MSFRLGFVTASRFSFVTVVACAAAGFASCTEPEPELTERDAFAFEMAETLCQGARGCCAERKLDLPDESCVTRNRNEVFIVMLEADDLKQEVVLDDWPSCVRRFEDAVAAAPSCDKLPHPSHLRLLCPEIFGDIAEGTGAPGEACDAVYDCASPEKGDRSCRVAAFNTVPVCTWLVPIEEGDVCGPLESGVIGVCGEERGCAPRSEGAQPTCGPLQNYEDPCVDNASCREPFVCSGGADPRCLEPLEAGDDCTEAIYACARSHFCEPSTGTCTDIPLLQDCGEEPCSTPLTWFCQG